MFKKLKLYIPGLVYASNIFYLLGRDCSKLPLMMLFFLLTSILDIVGLGLIVPFIGFVVNPEKALNGSLGQIMSRYGIYLSENQLLIYMGVSIVSVFLFKTISGILINRAILRFTWGQQTKLRTQLMKSFQSMSYLEYLSRNSSDYIQIIHSMVGQFILGVLQPLLRIFSEGIVVLAVLSFLAWTNLSALVLFVAMMTIVMIPYDLFFRRKIKHYGKLANQGATSMLQGVNEGMDGFKEIRILKKSLFFQNMVTNGANVNAINQVKSQIISTAPRYLFEFVIVSFIVSLVIVSIALRRNMEELIPTIALFGIAAVRLLPSANVLITGLTTIRFGRYPTSRIYTDLKKTNQTTEETLFAQKKQEQPFNELSLRNVYFKYPNAKNFAIQDVTLSIQAGESIGFIGSSGSGKTTLIDVLLGLLSLQSGSIFYNGADLNSVLGEWRSQIAYLPQKVFLIDNTLRMNIALGINDSEIDEGKLKEALRQSRLLELVKQLPEGDQTLIGEQGARLSGGQRQRIALARAFYHSRNVLIMDEATSSLDHKTEREIVDEIKHLKGKKTLIVIAHRLTTLEHCDRIYRIENGEIVGVGNYNEIVNHSNKK